MGPLLGMGQMAAWLNSFQVVGRGLVMVSQQLIRQGFQLQRVDKRKLVAGGCGILLDRILSWCLFEAGTPSLCFPQ